MDLSFEKYQNVSFERLEGNPKCDRGDGVEGQTQLCPSTPEFEREQKSSSMMSMCEKNVIFFSGGSVAGTLH